MKRAVHLCIVGFVGGALFVCAMAAAQTVDQERRDLATAKAQSSQAQARADVLGARAEAENDEAERARAQSAAVAARIQAAEADISAAEARIKLIDSLRAEQRLRLASRQEPAIRLLAALQTLSRRPPALALVQPGSTSDIVYVRAILATMLPVLRARTAGLRAEIEAGRRLKSNADRALGLLGESQKRLVGERAALVRLAAQHRSVSRRFSVGALAENDRALALGERARDIVDLIEQLGTQAETREQLASLPSPLLRPDRPDGVQLMPVQQSVSADNPPSYRLPVAGTLVTGLGEVSRSGVRARGLTIAVRPSAQVVAPIGGRIAYAGAYRGYGQIIIIDHGRGWTTLITSLAAIDVRVGDTVMQGSPIGKAGASRPTVTVELRKGVQPVDITPLIG